MNPIYYLTVDGVGISYNGILAEDGVICTQEQYENSAAWAIENGLIVPNPNLLANTKAMQAKILSRACALQILAGFASSALGAANIYASTGVDQQNLVQSAQCAKGGLLACQNTAGAWTREPHTQEQSQQVLADFVVFRDTSRLKLQAYEAQVDAATSIEQVQAVIWEAAS